MFTYYTTSQLKMLQFNITWQHNNTGELIINNTAPSTIVQQSSKNKNT